MASYKVKKGDTLSQIAKAKGVTLQALLVANPNIKNANQIRIGQSIKMPAEGSVKGNTKGSPYGRMSKTMMGMMKGTKGQQETVTKALRDEVKRSGAQTSATPKKAKSTIEQKTGNEALKEKARKLREKKKAEAAAKVQAAAKASLKKKAQRSMSGMRENDFAANKGGYAKKKTKKRKN